MNTPADYSYLPEYPALVWELHPFLKTIYRVGGGTVRVARIGGIGDVLCFTDNTLYPYLLYLEWSRELQCLCPAILRHEGQSNTPRALTTFKQVSIHLPALIKAHRAAIGATVAA